MIKAQKAIKAEQSDKAGIKAKKAILKSEKAVLEADRAILEADKAILEAEKLSKEVNKRKLELVSSTQQKSPLKKKRKLTMELDNERDLKVPELTMDQWEAVHL